MAKRFTDNEKWKKRFFKGLSTVNKLFFLYILDECDHAGIWHVEQDVAEMRIGEKLNFDNLKKELGKHLIEFDNGEKWFIPTFIDFQYGVLNPSVNVHKSVIDKLNRYNLLKKYQQLINSSLGVMDKDKDKNKDKDLDKRKEGFIKELQLYKDKFTSETLSDFFEYWSEPNKSKSKMKFEQQPTWDLNRRLKRWDKNNFNKSEQKPVMKYD